MKGENHGIPFQRCNRCAEPSTEDYCNKCVQACYDRCSGAIDEIGMEFDLELTYEQMAKAIKNRGYLL